MKAYKTKSDRVCICRKCEKPINKGDESVKLEDVYISPHRKDLFFHVTCWEKILEDTL